MGHISFHKQKSNATSAIRHGSKNTNKKRWKIEDNQWFPRNQSPEKPQPFEKDRFLQRTSKKQETEPRHWETTKKRRPHHKTTTKKIENYLSTGTSLPPPEIPPPPLPWKNTHPWLRTTQKKKAMKFPLWKRTNLSNQKTGRAEKSLQTPPSPTPGL